MASNGNDATTGYPIFLAGYAPDLGVDETTVAQYAADVGNRIVRANLAGLTAYTYSRAGLMGHALDTKSDYVHDGSGWKLMHRAPQAYTPTLTNITGGPAVTARYSVAGGWVQVSIGVALNGANFGTAPGFSLPVAARTPSGFQMLGQALYRAGSLWYEGGILLATSTRVDPVLKVVTLGNVAMNSNVGAATPFTWASGHFMALEFSYEAA